MKPFYIVSSEFELSEQLTEKSAIDNAEENARNNLGQRYVYEVRLIGKAAQRVDFDRCPP